MRDVPNDEDYLEQLPHGRHVNVRTLVNYGQLSLAQLDDGSWVALNYRSTDPTHLRSRDFRGEWARAQGFTLKEVEAYTRRKKNALKRAAELEQQAEAVAILRGAGYTVTK